mmetsp:Transcript_90466/g.251475  ORF Transcript_90466/g.251475 Transcript_90466/m.251475 type:complete len:206 (+) Transcript_90466:73-690(+)
MYQRHKNSNNRSPLWSIRSRGAAPTSLDSAQANPASVAALFPPTPPSRAPLLLLPRAPSACTLRCSCAQGCQSLRRRGGALREGGSTDPKECLLRGRRRHADCVLHDQWSWLLHERHHLLQGADRHHSRLRGPTLCHDPRPHRLDEGQGQRGMHDLQRGRVLFRLLRRRRRRRGRRFREILLLLRTLRVLPPVRKLRHLRRALCL